MNRKGFILGVVLMLGEALVPLNAQQTPLSPRSNTARLLLRQEWNTLLPQGAKLIDTGKVKHEQINYLAVLASGQNPKELRRTLYFMRWNGSRFVSESSLNLNGSLIDTLLVGHFRTTTISTLTGDKGKSGLQARTVQVVASDGVLEWNGKDWDKISPAPLGIKGQIEMGKRYNILLTGVGDQVQTHSLENNSLQAVPNFTPPSEEDTFFQFGIGSQDFPGVESLRMGQGTRYIQSHWRAQNRWMIGLLPGKLTPTQDDPKATVGDRLLLFAPRLSAQTKSFWASSQSEMDEVWRSDAFPGQVLDVRIGDPRNDGKEGLLVLVAENEGRDRRLYFFTRGTGL